MIIEKLKEMYKESKEKREAYRDLVDNVGMRPSEAAKSANEFMKQQRRLKGYHNGIKDIKEL